MSNHQGEAVTDYCPAGENPKQAPRLLSASPFETFEAARRRTCDLCLPGVPSWEVPFKEEGVRTSPQTTCRMSWNHLEASYNLQAGQIRKSRFGMKVTSNVGACKPAAAVSSCSAAVFSHFPAASQPKMIRNSTTPVIVGCGSKLYRWGKPQVLVFFSLYKGAILGTSFLSHSHMAPSEQNNTLPKLAPTTFVSACGNPS